jgi:hypothetical protein
MVVPQHEIEGEHVGFTSVTMLRKLEPQILDSLLRWCLAH